MKVGTVSIPKFNSLKKRLKLPQYAVVGLLESVWMLACQTSDDGDLSKHTLQEIADYADYDGDAKELIDAMVQTRWLDRIDDRLVVHDWDEHSPKFVKDRKWKREIRANRTAPPQQQSQPPTTLSENVAECRSMSPTNSAESRTGAPIQFKSSQSYSSQVNSSRERADTLSTIDEAKEENSKPNTEEKQRSQDSLSFAMERAKFTSQAFRDTFEKWRIYSRGKGKFIDAITEERQVMTLSERSTSEQDAIEMLNYTMMRNVVGLILTGEHRRANEPKGYHQTQPPTIPKVGSGAYATAPGYYQRQPPKLPKLTEADCK